MKDLVEDIFHTLNAEPEDDAVEALAEIGEGFAEDVIAQAEQFAADDGRDTITAEDIRKAAQH